MGYLADRLNRIGIEDKLLQLGARAGDAVAIGGADAVVFDFAPQVEIGGEILSRRGEDSRFEQQRPADPAASGAGPGLPRRGRRRRTPSG